jgi:hypothetical protein
MVQLILRSVKWPEKRIDPNLTDHGVKTIWNPKKLKSNESHRGSKPNPPH